MHEIDIVRHSRKISPRDGTLLGIQLLRGGILVGQMIHTRFQNHAGHLVRIFDLIIEDASDVRGLSEEDFREDNVLIPPMWAMRHCFGQPGTGRAIFSSLKQKAQLPELGESNLLMNNYAMYDPATRLFFPRSKYGVEPDLGTDRAQWTIVTWVTGIIAGDTPVEKRGELLIPNIVFSANNIDLFIARAFAYKEGKPLPIQPVTGD